MGLPDNTERICVSTNFKRFLKNFENTEHVGRQKSWEAQMCDRLEKEFHQLKENNEILRKRVEDQELKLQIFRGSSVGMTKLNVEVSELQGRVLSLEIENSSL